MSLTRPITIPIPGGYEFGYIDGGAEGIVAHVKNIHRDRSHSLTAEIDIGGARPDVPSTFLAIKLNLSSLIARKKLAKAIGESVEGNTIPWEEIIEDVTRLTIQLYREGDTPEEVWTSDDVKPPGYLLEPLLPLNQPTIFFGEGGSLKSYTAKLFGLTVLLPYYDNPLGLKTREESSPVLYYDYETSRDEFQFGLSAIAKGLKLGALSMQYLKAFSPLSDNVQALEKTIKRTGCKLLIVDSLAQAAGGNINEPEPAIRYFSALRRLNITSLTIAHTSKDQLNRTKSTFGSVFFTNYARSVWECKREQEEGEDKVTVGLFHRKANTSKLHLPIGFRFVFSDDSVSVSKENLQDTNLSGSLPTRFRIKVVLKAGALLQEQIEEALEDSSKDAIRKALKRMADGGQVQKLTDGRWGLSYQP